MADDGTNNTSPANSVAELKVLVENAVAEAKQQLTVLAKAKEEMPVKREALGALELRIENILETLEDVVKRDKAILKNSKKMPDPSGAVEASENNNDGNKDEAASVSENNVEALATGFVDAADLVLGRN